MPNIRAYHSPVLSGSGTLSLTASKGSVLEDHILTPTPTSELLTQDRNTVLCEVSRLVGGTRLVVFPRCRPKNTTSRDP